MRSRSIRLSIGILLILGLALAALGFKTISIDLPGIAPLERDGAGPLGLKLGLDLRGGGHLVYQADTGTRFDISFSQQVDYERLLVALDELRFGEDDLALEGYQLIPRDLTLVTREAPAADPVPPEEDTSTETVGEAGDAADAEDAGAQDAGPEDTGPEDDEADEAPVPETILVPVLTRIQIKTPILNPDDPRRSGLRAALAGELAEVELFQVTDITQPTRDQMNGVLDNITRRVNRFGTEEPIIQIFGDDRIIVQLPGASGSTSEVSFVDPVPGLEVAATMRSALETAGYENLEVIRTSDRTFRVTSNTVSGSIQTEASTALGEQVGPLEGFQVTSAIDEAKGLIGQTARLDFKERTCRDQSCTLFDDTDLGLSGDDLARAEAGADNLGVGWVVNLQFRDRGAEIFSELTRRIQNVPTKRIAVFMDEEQLVAPVALAWIRDGRTEISGNFTREKARSLAIQLESGRLPVPLKLIQESDVGPVLGEESLKNSLLAGLVGLGLVLVFVVAYYRMAGVVAAFALVFYSVIVLAVFKLIPITLELAHVGGFILSIGMAVDANILIFERMKEEVRIGRTLASSMEVGFSRAWPAIRDSNISTMITCLVLMWFGDRLGGGLVTGVAISLFIGVAVSMFTAVVVSRNLLQVLAWVGLSRQIRLFTPEPVPGAGQTTGQTMGGSR